MNEFLSAITAGRSPRLSRRSIAWIVAILAVLSLGSCSFFSVPRDHIGIVAPSRTESGLRIVEAGVYAKWPWQSVERIDGRIRLTDLPSREKRTGDGEAIVVHPYAAWHVEPDNAALFHRAGGQEAITTQLAELIWRALDIELANSRLTDLLGPGADKPSDREPLTKLTDRIHATCQPPALTRFGVQLLDVRINRLVCPDRAEPQILRRMVADRQRQIDRQRSEAEARATRIVHTAQAEADHVLAEADTEARQIEQDTEARIASMIRRAGFDPGFRELVFRMERYHRLLDENAAVVMSEGKFFDALFQPSATSKPQSEP